MHTDDVSAIENPTLPETEKPVTTKLTMAEIYTTIPQTKRSKNTTTQKTSNIELKNRYQILSEHEDSDSEMEQEQTTTKTHKPPPIVIKGRTGNSRAVINNLRDEIGDDFHVTYSDEATHIHIHDPNKRKTYINKMKAENVPHYTYAPKEERTTGHVIRGLDIDVSTEELKQQLEHLGITIENIYKMTTTHRPLYLVITPKNITTDYLQKNIKFLFYIKINWQRHYNKNL